MNDQEGFVIFSILNVIFLEQENIFWTIFAAKFFVGVRKNVLWILNIVSKKGKCCWLKDKGKKVKRMSSKILFNNSRIYIFFIIYYPFKKMINMKKKKYLDRAERHDVWLFFSPFLFPPKKKREEKRRMK